MSRTISQLLCANEPWFSLYVRDLERASGRPGTDIRLTAELVRRVPETIAALGLDPHDTHGRELYAGLQHKIAEHDKLLCEALGVKNATDVEQLIPAVMKVLRQVELPTECMAIRASVVKRLLKKQPPPLKTMKLLGYKSLDSMLKREPLTELYAVMRFSEAESWLETFYEQYKSLSPSDFECRDIKISTMNSKRLKRLAERIALEEKQNVVYFKELGTLLVLPLPVSQLRGYAITATSLLIRYFNEIRTYSAYLKLHQVRPDLGEFMYRTVTQADEESVRLLDHPLQWRVLQRYFHASDALPEFLEPNVQAADLSWERPEAVLAGIVPEISFWSDLENAGTLDGHKPVSFNLLDNAVSYCNRLDYSRRIVHHMQEALWQELISRYLGQAQLAQDVTGQLDGGLELEQTEIVAL